jgi:hypothetical protein
LLNSKKPKSLFSSSPDKSKLSIPEKSMKMKVDFYQNLKSSPLYSHYSCNSVISQYNSDSL